MYAIRSYYGLRDSNGHVERIARVLQHGKKLAGRVGVIGAGKFAAMYLAQVPRTPGVRIAAIADLAPANARANLERVGWSAELVQKTAIVEDWRKVVTDPRVDIVIEATGNPMSYNFV